MAIKDWFSRRTPLQMALERGSKPGGDLAEELGKLRNYSIKSGADAESICQALARLTPGEIKRENGTAFNAVVALFQQVEGADCPAFGVLADKGIDHLLRIADDALENPSHLAADDVLFVLKILAMYGTREGTDVVLRAARVPLRADSYMWSVILGAYAREHPERERLFKELSDPLPCDFLAVSLLDSANAAQRDGGEFEHPFDSAAGKNQLESWLTETDEEHFSYAVSAAAALPFISAPERDRLLALAFDHPNPDAQLEAAWAAAKLGRDAGIRWLARSCLDVNVAERAKHYLNELGRADAIPAEAQDASFQVRAEFAQWLAHPSELGRPPDEVEVIDHRELRWPPERESKSVWLLRYRLKDVTELQDDDVGVGLVGTVTFCLFTYKLEQRPPEDCYALHCYWEMNARGLIAENDVMEGTTDYDHMWSQCKRDNLGEARIIAVAELSPELQYPQRLVALATANRQGQPGWIVLDGPRSRWYSASEMPTDAWPKTVAMVHIGRVLLGFRDEPDRLKYLQPASKPRTPEQIITAFERLLEKARTDPGQIKKLLGQNGVAASGLPKYISALAALGPQSPAACTCMAYESLLAVASLADPSLNGELFDCFATLGHGFEGYVDALVELHRQTEVPELLEKFRPYWNHNLGYGKLGAAAFKSGHDQIAEGLLVKLRQSLKDWCRSIEMGYLAEIWKRQGRIEEAHSLMIDALSGLLEQSRTATGSDCKLFEDWFQARRATYLRLFPERADSELRRQGIARSTLSESPR